MKDVVCFPLRPGAAAALCSGSCLFYAKFVLLQGWLCLEQFFPLSVLTALAGNDQVAVARRLLAAPGLGTDAWTGKEGSPSWSRQQVSSDPP